MPGKDEVERWDVVTQEQSAQVEAAWVRFAADLRTFVQRRVSASDAEDILQLVFLRMTTSVEVLDEQRIVGWLYTTTRNAIVDYYRSAVRRREVLVDEFAVDEPLSELADQTTAETELAQCLIPMLELLPADQADALRMVDVAGHTQAAAAALAQVSVSGMKSRVQRGRGRLRELLLQCCDVDRDARGRVLDFAPVASHEALDRVGCGACGAY